MRVISGKYKGRKLEGFNLDGTRPTMDRVKESLFGIIQNEVSSRVCLDLFAGSGALGIEALSMGALECYFVDHSDNAIKVLKNNTRDMMGCHVIKSDYKRFLKDCKCKFDVIFLDPPYKSNLLNKALMYIDKYDLLNDGGIVVCEFECERVVTDLVLVKEKKYGSKYIQIFRK